MKKSIFNASFEESLNLYDDRMVLYAINHFLKEVETEEKMALRGTLKSTVWLCVLTVIFVFGLNLLPAFLSDLLFRGGGFNNFLVPPTTNFMTYKLYYILGIIWLGVVLLGKFFNQYFILGYRGHFHIFVTYILWLLIEFNLFFITFIFPTLGKWNSIIFFLLNVIIIVMVIYFRNQSLKRNLYGDIDRISKSDKCFQFLKNYGGLILFTLVLVKFFIKSRDLNFTDNVTFLGFLLLLFTANIIISIFEVYLIFPYMLTAYYKLKYSEEYRNWEGKSLEEWYGKKYLKKHKELTKNE
ncbi:hypothetical protein SAMN05216347_1123 [Streptococcus equinus]|uniref:Uncharacterized protein n=1 Tax=Streptococcus equinus TaxID=1335 RepID=A0A1H0RBM4_STREI|nr:hypothetical protein [Streptococcus equinus]SDP26780.1 hypothetical protein SAMN05216347_1123 [Streptococcus equinus]SFB78706.1 hypothetical protein SAMN05216408_0036 [Streptococcus equinus]